MRLCDRDIEAWLDEGRLSINPRPPVERINGATVDVRLGNKFRTFRGHTAAFIDLSGPKDEVSAALDRVMSDEIVLDESEAFYLHPGELALAVTLVCLFGVLLPALMKGANTLLMTFIVCAYVAVVSLTIVGGVQKKSVCAMLGAVAGTALALLFGLLAQALTRVDGLRIEDVEPLLQLRQTGTPIGLRGLLVGGIIISALGAVMDVTMGIASSLAEVHAANPQLSRRELFRSGMNIGRDMVGTMTNTLILAFLGSGFTLILYLYSLGLSFRQLMSSAYVSMEVVSGVASSVGVILSIPLTALITAAVFTREKQQS